MPPLVNCRREAKGRPVHLPASPIFAGRRTPRVGDRHIPND